MGPHTEGLSCDQSCPHSRPIKGIVQGNVGKQLWYSRIVPDNLLCLQENLYHRGWRLFQGLHLDPIREDDSRDLDEVRQVPPNTVLHAVHETQHETQDVHAGLQQHLHSNQDLRTVQHLFPDFPGLVLEIREIPGLVLGRQQFLGQQLHVHPSVPKAQWKQKSHVRWRCFEPTRETTLISKEVHAWRRCGVLSKKLPSTEIQIKKRTFRSKRTSHETHWWHALWAHQFHRLPESRRWTRRRLGQKRKADEDHS